MSEWFSVLVVFWVLWAVDGLRLLPRRGFTVIGCMGGDRTRAFTRKSRGSKMPTAPHGAASFSTRSAGARVRHGRLSLPGWLPSDWRTVVTDVPLALSPMGICNVAVGAAGRPWEKPGPIQAWRWEEIRSVGIAGGWIYVNDAGFCADTGQVKAAELLALARLEPGARQKRIETLMRLWFRPGHLRRRASVLQARTARPALLNALTFVGILALTIYVVGDIASRLPAEWSEQLAASFPWVLVGLLVTHMAAVALALRAKRRLRAVTGEKRGATLFSALLLPPQALRLRALLGEGFFPAQYPMAAIIAFGDRGSIETHAFNVLADLRWPLDDPDWAPLAREIVVWYRGRLESTLREALTRARVSTERLLQAPAPDSPASCAYCPRCRDQFVSPCQVCPNGVVLRSLRSNLGGATAET